MKIKTSELTDAALDWAVAKCEGYDYSVESGLLYKFKEPHFFKSYSTDWAQGGPIIERELIEISFSYLKGMWVASGVGAEIGPVEARSKLALVAAMRCYVASKLGDEVEIPEGLTNL